MLRERARASLFSFGFFVDSEGRLGRDGSGSVGSTTTSAFSLFGATFLNGTIKNFH